MNDVIRPGQELKAEAEIVDELTAFLVKHLDEWLAEHAETKLLDLLMVGHSFHKIVVTRVAIQWARGDIPLEKTFKIADTTWHKAMRELWRLALKAS